MARIWTADDPGNPVEPWVWGEDPPDSTSLHITTDQSMPRNYVLEPDMDNAGSWQPLGTPGNSHPWAYWLVPHWDPLTEVV